MRTVAAAILPRQPFDFHLSSMVRRIPLVWFVLSFLALKPGARTIVTANTPVPTGWGRPIPTSRPRSATTSCSPLREIRCSRRRPAPLASWAPNIGLNWTYTGASTGWQFHAWTGAAGEVTAGPCRWTVRWSTARIRSPLPRPAARVILNSFNFIGDTNSDTYQYRVDLVNVTTGTRCSTTTGAVDQHRRDPYCAAPCSINHTAATTDPLRLDIVRIGGAGVAGNIAIDNLDFDQTAPSTPPTLTVQAVGILQPGGKPGSLPVSPPPMQTRTSESRPTGATG